MTKAKVTQKIRDKLSNYKFDTSTYIILESGVRRDAATGRLTVHAGTSKGNKQKQK